MKTIGTIIAGILGVSIGIIVTIIEIALFLAIYLGIPLIIIYAIYRAVKGLMTHNANLKRQRDNDEWRKG